MSFLSISSSTFTFISDSLTSTPVVDTITDNLAQASISSIGIYGTPSFKTYPRETGYICFDSIASFPYIYELSGPCTDAEDTFYPYSIEDLPEWATFSSVSTTSMQAIGILSTVDFGFGYKVEHSNALKATNGTSSLERPFTLIVY